MAAGAGGAGRDDSHVRPHGAGEDGDVARDGVRQDVGQEEGAHAAGSAFSQDTALLFEEDVAAGAGAEHDAGPRPKRAVKREACVAHSLERCHGAELASSGPYAAHP